MAETLSFNEKLLALFPTDLLKIKTETSGYYITVNDVFNYIIDPADGIPRNYPIAYFTIGDHTPLNESGEKNYNLYSIDLQIGIINKIQNITVSEQAKENIIKSIKFYLYGKTNGVLNNDIRKQTGFDAYYLSKTYPIIKSYTHITDNRLILVTADFKIKINLIQ